MITHDLHNASPIGLLLSNPLDAKLLRHFLASMGHGIKVLEGGAQSLQAIEGSGLILADEASASHHAECLLEMKREADPFLLPVLVMAGEKSDSAKWIRRGFDDVLRMPLVKGELMVRLETFLRLRAASQRAHKESEERFRVTFDEAPSGIAHTALDGRVLMVNRRLCEMLGYGQAELLRLRSADITFAEDIEATQQLRRRVIAGRSAPPAVAKRYVRKDGTVFWGELSISSVRDDQGEPKYFINIISDISARKALESRLERLARARHFMAECNRILVHATAETQLLEDMCREAVTSGGYRIAWVGMAQQDARKTVLPVVSAGPVTDYLKSEFISWSADHPSGQGAIGRAIRSGELTEISDIAAEASLGHWHALAEQRALRSVVVLPLKVAGSVIGGMAIVSGSAGALSGDERELLGELAADISYGIETLRTRQAHAAAEKALCESERFARSTIDALAEHICVLDESGTIIAINRSWRAFAAANGNVDRDCIAEGCNYLEVCDRAAEAGSDEAARVAAAIRAAIAGNDQGFSLEYACHAPDEQRWFLMRVSRFAGEGSTRVVVSHEAVTERRLMEDALRASEERFRSLTHLSSDWYWEQDEKFRFNAMSGSTLDLVWPYQNASIGKTRREMHESEPSMHYVGMSDADWVAHQAMLDTHRAFRDQVYRHRRADGQTTYVSVSGEPVFNEHGVFKGYRGTGKDITAQKAVEQALRDSEERFRSLTNLSSDWYWEQDKDFRFTSISGDAAARSIPRDNFSIGRTRQEMHALRPSDYYIDMNEADWLMHQALLDAHKPFRNHVFQQRGADGQIQYFSISGQPFYDQDGVFKGYRGVGRDQTAEKRAEQALRESEARFKSLTELTSDWYWEQDEQYRFVSFAGVFEEDTGFDRDEAIGKTRWDFDRVSPRAYVGVTDQDWEAHRRDLDERKPFRDLVYCHQTGEGKFNYVSLSGEPFYDDAGNFKGYRGTGKYVNEQKRVEQELVMARERMEFLLSATPAVIFAREAQWPFAPTFVSDNMRTQFGYKPAEILDNPDSNRQARIHPDDLPRFLATLPKVFEGGRHSLEFRFQHSEGHYVWVREEARLVQSTDGRREIVGYLIDVDEKKHFEEQLLHLAHYDALTELPNRVLFYDRLQQAVAQAYRNNWNTGVLFIDLDRFKVVNDTLGHGTGDELLRQVSARLNSTVRGGDTVGRLGGDEFAVILGELNHPEDAQLVTQKIMGSFEQPFELSGREVFVTASIGITVCPADGEDPDTLIKNADAAMYRAKDIGRNNVQFYTPEMNSRALERLDLENALRRALERDEFLLHYQPKVSTRNGKMVGVEALLRWQRPGHGLVSPAEFIPILEETGLIVPVGEWVLRTACAQLRAWDAEGRKLVPVAVNLSAKQLQSTGLTGVVRRILEESGVDSALIELEITESSLMHNTEDAVALLNELRKTGLRISIDDFGTGYSSLAYLKRFPVHTLKIDRTFVRDVNVDENDAAIARAIITMAHQLSLKVVAEGVETDAQLAFLVENGCDEAQGFLFSRPVPADKVYDLPMVYLVAA